MRCSVTVPGGGSPGSEESLGHAKHKGERVLARGNEVDERQHDHPVHREAGQHGEHVVGQLHEHRLGVLHLDQLCGHQEDDTDRRVPAR